MMMFRQRQILFHHFRPGSDEEKNPSNLYPVKCLFYLTGAACPARPACPVK